MEKSTVVDIAYYVKWVPWSETVRFRYSFTGPYSFLSNDFCTPVYHNGHIFPSVFCAYLTTHYDVPSEAIGRLIILFNQKKCAADYIDIVKGEGYIEEKADWKLVRLSVLEKLIRDKFRRNADLRKRLCDSGDRLLLWVNNDDSFLGLVLGKGHNHLGRLLMELRSDIKNNVELEAWVNSALALQKNMALRPSITLLEYKPPDLLTPEATHCLDRARAFCRTHALLTIDEEKGLVLADLKSTAGTYLNGSRLEQDHIFHVLDDGSKIKFGASDRIYVVQTDKTRVEEYLKKKEKSLQEEIKTLSASLKNPEKAKHNTEKKIFLKNLSYKTTKEDLMEFFQNCGDITELILPSSTRRTFNPGSDVFYNRGVAIITFGTPKAAALAIEKNGSFLNQRHLYISYATDQKEKSTEIKHGLRRGRKSDWRSTQYKNCHDSDFRNDRYYKHHNSHRNHPDARSRSRSYTQNTLSELVSEETRYNTKHTKTRKIDPVSQRQGTLKGYNRSTSYDTERHSSVPRPALPQTPCSTRNLTCSPMHLTYRRRSISNAQKYRKNPVSMRARVSCSYNAPTNPCASSSTNWSDSLSDHSTSRVKHSRVLDESSLRRSKSPLERLCHSKCKRYSSRYSHSDSSVSHYSNSPSGSLLFNSTKRFHSASQENSRKKRCNAKDKGQNYKGKRGDSKDKRRDSRDRRRESKDRQCDSKGSRYNCEDKGQNSGDRQSDFEDRRYDFKVRRYDSKDRRYNSEDRRRNSEDRRYDSKDRQYDSKERRYDSKDRQYDSKERQYDSKDRQYDSKKRRYDSKDRQCDSKGRRYNCEDKGRNSRGRQGDFEDRRYDSKDRQCDSKGRRYNCEDKGQNSRDRQGDFEDRRYDSKDRQCDSKGRRYNCEDKGQNSGDRQGDFEDRRYDSKDGQYESKDKQRYFKEKRRDSEDRRRDSEDRRRASGDRRRDFEDRRRASEDRRRASEDRRRASEDRRRDCRDRQCDFEDRRYDSKDRQCDSKGRRYNREDKGQNSGDRQCDFEDKRRDSEDRECVSEDRECVSEDRECVSEDRECVSEDRECVSEDRECVSKDIQCDSKIKRRDSEDQQYNYKDKGRDVKKICNKFKHTGGSIPDSYDANALLNIIE